MIFGITKSDNQGKVKRWYEKEDLKGGVFAKKKQDLLARFTAGRMQMEDKRVFFVKGAEKAMDREQRGTLVSVEIFDYQCIANLRGIRPIALLPLGFFEMETSEGTNMTLSLFQKLYSRKAEDFWNELIDVEELYARQPEIEHTPALRKLIEKVKNKSAYLYETFQYENRFSSFRFYGGH